MKLRIGPKFRPWQADIYHRKERFQVYALHRRAGKTEQALIKLCKSAATCDKDLGLYYYVAPLQKQATQIAWNRLKQLVSPLVPYGAARIKEVEKQIQFPNGSIVAVMGADQPDSHRGIRLDGVVLDEVAQMKPEVWHDVLQPALSDRLGWAQFIGTPNGVNMFSELFYKAKREDGWFSAAYTAYDTNAIDPDELGRLRKNMSEASFAREYLCDFAAAGDDQVISIADVELASLRAFRIGEMDYAPRIVGVDPARFGDDRSVIFKRQGLQAFDPIVMQGLDQMTLAAKIAAVINDWTPDAVFIDSGMGAGVIDRLRELNHDVIEVNFGGKSSDAAYLNKRAEMWFGVREWIMAGGAIPNMMELKQDLGAPTYWIDRQNRIQLESKEDIKKRGLPSPDLGDALALTFAHPVAKKSLIEQLGIGGIHNKNPMSHDPYRDL